MAITKPPSALHTGGSHVERASPINYNMAFRICGPTPRVRRVERKKPGGAPKYPDDAVRLARKLYETKSAADVALAMQSKYPGVKATWVRQVVDGVIRGDVR